MQTYSFFMIFAVFVLNKLNIAGFLSPCNNFLIAKVILFKKKAIYL